MTDCAICLQLLQIPVKVLTCGHSFCLPCLRQMRRQRGPWNPGRRITLSCPTCRHETPLRNGRVHELPTNYALNELLEIERRNNPGTENDQLQLQSVQQAEEDLTSSYFFNSNPIQGGDIANGRQNANGRRNANGRQNVVPSGSSTSTVANYYTSNILTRRQRRIMLPRGIGDVLENWGVLS